MRYGVLRGDEAAALYLRCAEAWVHADEAGGWPVISGQPRLRDDKLHGFSPDCRSQERGDNGVV